MKIHGYHEHPKEFGSLSIYGSDAIPLGEFLAKDPAYGKPIHPSSDVLAGEILWAVKKEMARTVEDFLSRRRRVLIRDAAASIRMAPKVARVMSEILGKDPAWQKTQVEHYTNLARGYLPQ